MYSFVQSHIKVMAEETGDGVESKIAVVWDFEHISAMTAAVCAVPPEEKPADDLLIMPRLTFSEVTCNCTKFPHLGDVIIVSSCENDAETVSQSLQNLDLGSESGSEEGMYDDESEEKELHYRTEHNTEDAGNVEMYSETITLKGSSYHSSF